MSKENELSQMGRHLGKAPGFFSSTPVVQQSETTSDSALEFFSIEEDQEKENDEEFDEKKALKRCRENACRVILQPINLSQLKLKLCFTKTRIEHLTVEESFNGFVIIPVNNSNAHIYSLLKGKAIKSDNRFFYMEYEQISGTYFNKEQKKFFLEKVKELKNQESFITSDSKVDPIIPTLVQASSNCGLVLPNIKVPIILEQENQGKHSRDIKEFFPGLQQSDIRGLDDSIFSIPIHQVMLIAEAAYRFLLKEHHLFKNKNTFSEDNVHIFFQFEVNCGIAKTKTGRREDTKFCKLQGIFRQNVVYYHGYPETQVTMGAQNSSSSTNFTIDHSNIKHYSEIMKLTR